MSRDLLAVAAVATTAAFAGGALITQTVIVPHWRSMDPGAFLDHFATYGPATGATLFPIEVIATLALSGSTYLAVRNRRPARALWRWPRRAWWARCCCCRSTSSARIWPC